MLTLSSASVKLYSPDDVLPLSSLSLLAGESGAAQIFVEGNRCERLAVKVESRIGATAYAVHKIKCDYYRPDDGYYQRREDHLYPDLLTPADFITLDGEGRGVLFLEIPAQAGARADTVTVTVGEESVALPVSVADSRLAESDLILTHWLYSDCICN